MDPRKPIEDQFSKLHPCLPPTTRIGIIGGGPSGLSAAYALAKLGYDNITVLEKHHTVGGMCESVDIEGRVYDLGGQVLAANSAPFIFHLAKETGSELVEMDNHKLAMIDSSTGKYGDIKVADDYASMISLTLEIEDMARESGQLGVHAVSGIAPEITPEYLNGRGIKSVPMSVAYGYTASGYGFVHDMPYAYIHEFTRTSMAGKIRRFRDGYTSVWEKLAGALPIKLQCNTEVTAVRRNSDGVAVDVRTSDGEVKLMEFDRIIVSGAFPIKSGKTYHSPDTNSTEPEIEVMDTSDLEQDYVGGLMAFELTERNASYSMSLMSKHFATDVSPPKHSYVKRLFPLQSEFLNRTSEDLDECPGVQFPDLSTLDGYKELNDNASCIAHQLLASKKPVIKPGDRVLLVHVPGLDFVDAFFGCLRAKVLPVPVLPSDPLQRGGQALLKIENVAKSSNAVAILSTLGYHSAVRAGAVKNMISLTKKDGKAVGRWPDLPWIHTDSLIKNSKNLIPKSTSDPSDAYPSDLCFLQFTSGSTGDAKGVMITHGGLIHNVKLMRKVYKSTSKTVLVSWLPQYHDMGLIGGLFTALVSGGSAILFSPMTFIKKPLMWLQTMSKYKATHSAGPNFAFELMVRRLESYKEKTWDFDLSSMIFLMVAAEPVRQKTLKRFIDLTRPFGISQEVMAPGYGLAENCVFVSCAFGQKKPIFVDWQGRICCGYTHQDNKDVDIRIVHPETHEENEEVGKEGEIWISSPSAGVGYWGREDLSQKTFRNELLKHPGRVYTRTGDLGRIVDGNLFITGRIKDLIIVAGRNIYSADVEKTVESSSDLLRPGCCAVIGVPEEILSSKGLSISDTSDQVGLVVIAEMREGKAVNKELIEQIQTRVAEEHGVSVASVKLIKPKTISKTTSGKIKRFECLKQFADETLSLVEQRKPKKILIRSYTTGSCKDGNTPRSQLVKDPLSLNAKFSNKQILEFLKSLVSEQTRIPINNISTTESLVSYGIDSIGVVRAAQKLSDFLGVPVGAVDIFTATCIADLADFAENLVRKTQPESMSNEDITEPEIEVEIEVSKSQQLVVWSFQLLSLLYVSALLLLPAYISISSFTKMLSFNHISKERIPCLPYLVPLALAPLYWILCIFSTCICIAFLGNSFLQPNYVLTPEISIWSMNFVKWWALYKAQDTASKVLAVHLRGTVFLKYWFEMLGAKIGSGVLLDSVEITDPSLVSIGDGSVIAEGALIQSHEVKNGMVSFLPIRIGRNSSVGPYAVIQKGSLLGDEAQVPALQSSEGGKCCFKSTNLNNILKGTVMTEFHPELEAIYHFMGIYVVSFLSSLSAAIVYFLYIQLSQKSPSVQNFSFVCISGAFHWIPLTIVAYATMVPNVSSPINFASSVAIAYLAHGLVLCLLTSTLTRVLAGKPDKEQSHIRTWFRHRITISCHLRFAKLLSGTEAFCIYLRLLGAKIGKHCSIRAINPVADASLLSLGAGVHLGDFSRILTGVYTSKGFSSRRVEVQDNSVVGIQSLLLPGSVIQENVVLGALSVAPTNSVLQRGGIYIGSQAPVMIKNTMHALDERIEEMDMRYKKIVGGLAANLAATTLKVKSRYFHRIGVSGKGVIKIYDNITGFPDHGIFAPGKIYPIIVRHSNSLSADDDARSDARGAALRILSDDTNNSSSILDLTLKTGKAFYARTISDFATWLVCGLPAREEHVKRDPHIRDAVWTSLRLTDSYTDLHYYSNICRLFRFKDGQEMYVKFKLRPEDENISEDAGKVHPTGILPPETGAIPREESDTRPLLFLADDFHRRVSAPGGVRYIFQLQFRPVPKEESIRDIALDCTKPWDDKEFPNVDIGEITIGQNLDKHQSEALEFNPFLRCQEVDVIRASSCTQSASIDHGRSLIYQICQHLRNGEPLPEAWRNFIEQSDVKVDLSGCPMAAAIVKSNAEEVTLTRTWYQTLWAIFIQPLLQTVLPHFVLGLVIFAPLSWMLHLNQTNNFPLHWLLPLFWTSSGLLAGLTCAIAKWVLVGKKKEHETVHIWSRGVFMDTIWQALRTVVGDYFMEMTTGSVILLLWMKLMGSEIDLNGAYVDTMEASLNPEMVEIEGAGSSVERQAMLFGHIYEGDGGKVKFGKIKIGEGGFVGSRAVVMPGVTVESWGNLSALTLAMKEEVIKSR